MDLDLHGRVALVTGASKGIGLAVAKTLLDEGAQVVAVSRKSTPELEQLAGANLLHVPADFLDADGPAHAVERAVSAFGGLDILVNNAGGPPAGVTLPTGPFLGGTDETWQAIYELNLFSLVRATRAAVPHLLERGGGAIVNVSSALARQPSAMNIEYSTAKAAVTALTKTLSEEFGPQGIRVNTVSPGVVRTPWWTDEGGVADAFAAQAGTDRDTILDTMVPEMLRLTTGRFVEPQEIADVVALLVSPRSGSTTGTDFIVDGGLLKEI